MVIYRYVPIIFIILLLFLLDIPPGFPQEKEPAAADQLELPPAIQEFINREIEKLPPLEQHYRRAQNYQAQGKLKEAIAELDLALKEDPNDVPSNCELGIVYLGQGEYDLAVNQLEKTRKLNPQYPKTYYALSNVYARRPEPDVKKARENLDKAVELGYHPVPWFLDYLKRLEEEKSISAPGEQTTADTGNN